MDPRKMVFAFPSRSGRAGRLGAVSPPARHGAPARLAGLPLVLAAGLALASCGPAPVPQAINDPREAANREVHALNRSVDQALVRPISGLFGDGPPGPVSRGVSNFADNLDVPGDVVNGVLQGRIGPAAENTLRFVLNSTIGLLGIFDVAGALGVQGKTTDFGETLHVWGAGEGAYVELPLLGPSTERDVIGRAVDVALNPMRFVLREPESTIATVAGVASNFGDRSRYSNTIDSVLYDSADSYAQSRLLYLQNRRFELGQVAGDDTFVDPYEDPYAE